MKRSYPYSKPSPKKNKPTTSRKMKRLRSINPSNEKVVKNILANPYYERRRNPVGVKVNVYAADQPRNKAIILSRHESMNTPVAKRVTPVVLDRERSYTPAKVPEKVHANLYKGVYKPLPAGEILSSSHVSNKQRQLQYNAQFSHKYLPNRGALMRELKQDRYRRNMFPNQVFTMLLPGVEMPRDVAVFKVPMTMSKPMIKNYLEEIYKVRVKKVNTAIMVGKKVLSKWGIYKKLPDYKKAYVRVADPFRFPWVRPQTYPVTPRQKKKNKERAEKERAEEAAREAEENKYAV